MLMMQITLRIMLKNEPAEAELANKKPNRTEPFDPWPLHEKSVSHRYNLCTSGKPILKN